MIVIKSYWYSQVLNFGDLLTPLVLSHFDIHAENYPINESEIVVVGSILQDLKPEYRGYILGSGLIKNIRSSFENAQVRGIRGFLTKERLGIKEDIVLGDPGILASALIENRSSKAYALGVVPHYVDKNNKGIKDFCAKYRDDVLIIDVQAEPKSVIAQIDQCMYVVSSSLHGIIVADSLGIPSGWLVLSKGVIGDGFKFYDYYSNFHKKPAPLNFSEYSTLSELIKDCKLPDNSEIECMKACQEDMFSKFFYDYSNNQ